MYLKTHKIYSKAEAEASDPSPYQEKNLNAAVPNLGSSKLIEKKIEEIKSILFNESLFAFFLHLYYYFKEPSGLDHE